MFLNQKGEKQWLQFGKMIIRDNITTTTTTNDDVKINKFW